MANLNVTTPTPKWVTSIVTAVAGSLVLFVPTFQVLIAAHPQVATLLAALYAFLAGILPSPISSAATPIAPSVVVTPTPVSTPVVVPTPVVGGGTPVRPSPAPVNSSVLSAASIAAYARLAGFPEVDLTPAVAIAEAESSGNPRARGDNGNSYGLWQIYMPAHPEFTGWNLDDPQTNANAAFSVYTAAGNNFTPWSTYNDGRYKAYLAIAQTGVSA